MKQYLKSSEVHVRDRHRDLNSGEQDSENPLYPKQVTLLRWRLYTTVVNVSRAELSYPIKHSVHY